MKYSYEFKKDSFGDLGLVLPEEISLFSNFYVDGLRMLEIPEEVSNSVLEEWEDFLFNLYNKLRF